MLIARFFYFACTAVEEMTVNVARRHYFLSKLLSLTQDSLIANSDFGEGLNPIPVTSLVRLKCCPNSFCIIHYITFDGNVTRADCQILPFSGVLFLNEDDFAAIRDGRHARCGPIIRYYRLVRFFGRFPLMMKRSANQMRYVWTLFLSYPSYS